ncbi:MAG TPA: hypothetical protein VIY53_13260 [Acidobacteriaceae bacterium]
MNAAQKVREPAAVPEKEKVDWMESMTKLFTAGVGRMAEVEKESIDVAVHQNAELLDLWKKGLAKVPGTPGLFLLELAGDGFERYAEIQKSAIDLFVEQGKAFAGLARDRTATASKASEEVDAFAKKSVARVIAMQKKALDHSAVQAKAVVESSSKQFGAGHPMGVAAETVQRGVDAFVDAQKGLLDLAVR